MNAVNNVGATLDSYYKKHRYKNQDAAKEKSEEQSSPQEEPGVVLSVNLNEQSMLGGAQSETESTISQMMKNLEGAKGLDAEAILLAAKQQILDMLIKSARMLLSVRYTAKSWKGLVDALKLAMPLTGSDKAVLLDKAISIMQGGLAGMELANADQNDDGVREQLPMEQSIAGAGTSAEATASAAAAGGAAPVAVNAVNISV